MIQVEQLTRTYGGTRAIDELSFEVARGDVVGFLGPNGAGKSTTMRILAGALGATSGRALVGGIDVFERPTDVKRLVGYLPEVPPLYGEMTVRAFLTFCARIKRAPDPAVDVEDALRRVRLGDVAHRLVGNLSKGYRQRVGLAAALVHRPPVLILDEPTSGLDPAQRVEVRELLRELAAGETTVVLSTHVLAEVEAVCDRVIIIHKGRIVAMDRLDVLRSRAASVRLVVARPADALQQVLAAVPGVTSVRRDGDAWRVGADRDVREAVAAAAVPYGLLHLAAEGQLEEVFLHLTAEAA
jgi:ABC-2 type transport system ATP-binding protein